jgi:hypothetical protein
MARRGGRRTHWVVVEEESKANRSRSRDFEFGLVGVVLGRGVEATVGGFEGVLDTHPSVNEPLVVG